MHFRWFPLYSADDGAPSGAGDGADGGGEKPPRASELLARYGKDADAALRMAEEVVRHQGENFGLREKNRQLRQRATDLEAKVAEITKAQPGEGAVVLSPEDARRWRAYAEIGDEPAAIQAVKAERDTLQQRLAALEREQILRDIAEIGIGGARLKVAVLKDRDERAGGLTYRVRDGEQDGKPAKVVYVAADGKETPLAEYAREQWADFLPALLETPPPAHGTAYVPQSSGGRAPAQSAAQQYIKKTPYAAPGKP